MNDRCEGRETERPEWVDTERRPNTTFSVKSVVQLLFLEEGFQKAYRFASLLSLPLSPVCLGVMFKRVRGSDGPTCQFYFSRVFDGKTTFVLASLLCLVSEPIFTDASRSKGTSFPTPEDDRRRYESDASAVHGYA